MQVDAKTDKSGLAEVEEIRTIPGRRWQIRVHVSLAMQPNMAEHRRLSMAKRLNPQSGRRLYPHLRLHMCLNSQPIFWSQELQKQLEKGFYNQILLL